MSGNIKHDSRPDILLIVTGQSPYNRSIWTGFAEGFQSLGYTIKVADARDIPDPATLTRPPKLLLSIHGANTPIDKIQAYRDVGTDTAVYLLDEPYEVDRTVQWSRHYDQVFSVDRTTVPIHGKFTRATFLPLAYNSQVFNPEVSGVASRILVLGSPFEAREHYLAAIRDRWGELVTWVGPGWKNFSPAGTHYDHFVTPQDCARFYRGADIVINIHRDSQWSHFGEQNKLQIKATHLNPRFWETAGCRSFQLCSYRADIEIYGNKTCSFLATEEMIEKIEYFLNNKKARRAQAKRTHRKMHKHTYSKRCLSVLNTMKQYREN